MDDNLEHHHHEKEKEKRSGFLKYLPYLAFFCLIVIIALSIYIRTPNIENLKDVTTGNYTLGPDLDPFLYLRNAKEIIATGTVASPDMMWSAPIGSPSYAEQSLMPWTIVWLYKFLNIFTPTSVEYAAIILPVILFAITLIFFFLFVQKIFSFVMKKEYSYIIAVISTLLYAVIPEMLHRTTAGIPEIESLGMVFFWLAFYFFISAWQSEKIKKSLIFSALAGISTALMIFSWGGVSYIFMAFSLATLISFLFQKISRKNILVFTIWWFLAILGSLIKGTSISGILSGVPDTLFSTIILFILWIDLLLYDFIMKDHHKQKIKIPRKVFSLAVSFAIMILGAIILLGPNFILDKIGNLVEGLLHPFGETRVGLTVAENRAPYYTEVFGAFATNFFNMTISLFWLFFFGTILMFYSAIIHFDKRNKIILLSLFVVFITLFIFSRYSPDSILNGENFLSQLLYFGSLFLLFGGIIYVFIKEKQNLQESFYKINYSYLLLLGLVFFAIISMRGAVRLFFIISPPMIIASSFLPIKLFEIGYESKDALKKYSYLTLVLFFAIMITILAVNYGRASYNETKYTIPGPYQQQWQYAMEWVREETPENSIFAHWWDYGYWIQAIGQRPTVTDGAHLIEFWDHTTARYLMTAEEEKTTLQLCKAHNISYILFDSTDIGKYGAYASIGSDKTKLDRASWIPTYVLDEKQTQELKNETIYVYTGGFWLDEDIIWNDQLLPQLKAGIAGFFVHNQDNQIKSVDAIVIYNNQRYDIPINYIYINNKKIKIAENGIDGVFYFVPKLTDAGLNPVGSAFFISEKVANGEFARTYLLGETSMTLAHQEDAQIVKQIKQFYNITNVDFIYANDLYGPIKIFKVPDLSSITYYPEYLERKSIDENIDPGRLDYLGK